MSKYIKTTLIFAGIWFIASLMNGLLSGISIILLDATAYDDMGTVALSCVFSFLFSAPLVGLVWFISVIAQATDKKGNELFQFVLSIALVIAVTAALIFVYTVGTEFMKARFVVALIIIVSALTSVLIFRKQIKTNE